MSESIVSKSISRKLFELINYTCMILLGILCLLPFIHIFAISLSSSAAANAGMVKLWPVDWNFDAFSYILNEPRFIQAFGVSIKRIVAGTLFGLLVTVLTAYPLSKESNRFEGRNVYAWYFVVTMLISGGMVPTYMTIKQYGLLDNFWSLILPSVVSIYYVVLMLNFFRGLPKELEESSFVDGAGHWTILFRIYLPLSLPSLATIALFTMVGHWNSWFDGLLYMNRAEHYPLQTYLQTLVTQPDLTKIHNIALLKDISPRTVKTAQLFVGMIPMLLVYPFLQRFFIKGIVLGSVKG